MKRVLLFLATNIAVLLVLSITLQLLGIDTMLNEQGGINMTTLLIMAAVLGMGGSFISLAMSKWMAKRAMGAQVIVQPQTATEKWLVETVRRQAEKAGIGMPEVAIFDAPEMNAFATGMNRNNALVAVSSGLLNGMKRDEVEAVLGHEISHVANGDMITLALIQGVVNTFRHRAVTRCGPSGGQGGVQDRARLRTGILCDQHCCPAGARYPGQHDRDVVQSPA